MNMEAYNNDPQVRRNLIGFVLLTLVIAYYVIFTLSEGYSIAWFSIFGIAAYLGAGWLLLVPAKAQRK